MCSNTYLPLTVVSSMAVVLVVLTTPFTRNATTATIRMHATVSATAISTSVIPCKLSDATAPLACPDLFSWEFIGCASSRPLGPVSRGMRFAGKHPNCKTPIKACAALAGAGSLL
jgi:hypothetical protein